jgi:hypothetical protein
VNALRLLVLVSALALTGCQFSRTATADPVEYELGQSFSLGGGDEAVIRGEQLRLRFTDVLEDSRCPSQVECVWTGQARIAVLVEQPGREPSTREFNTNPAPGQNAQTARVGAYTIALTALDPYPQTPEQSIGLEDYRATLSVRKA